MHDIKSWQKIECSSLWVCDMDVTSFVLSWSPVLVLAVLAGILLSNLLVTSGSLDRLVAYFTQGVRHPSHRHLFITLGICNFLE